ncbi:MAG: tetratricopeptide repeat protein, partial [Nitrospirota bacterium]|nr:tetratricopeptide repeat protein [Nitrospirota bacterium]
IIREAQKYMAKGQIDKAISEWERLVGEYSDGNFLNILGDLYIKKGDRKKAIASFHGAAGFFRNEGFTLKSLALYKKVLNIDSTDADALYALGELSEEKGLISDATKYYLATADSKSKVGEKDSLLDIYEKILSLSPSNIPLRIKVAEIFLKEGLKSNASKEYIYIAEVYDEKGDIPKSMEYYQKVLDLQPLNKEAVIGISYLYEKTGELNRAIEHMKEAVALFPDDLDVIFRCAELSLLTGDSENAKEYLRKFTEIEPDNLKSRKLLGEIYLKEGLKEKAWEQYLPVLDEIILEAKYEDAIQFLESFREVDAIGTGRKLALLYRQIGEDTQAATELVLLGDRFNEKGLTDEALTCYREALTITPDEEDLKGKVAEIAGQEIEEVEVIDEIGFPEADMPDHISVTGDKTTEEIFTDADIFQKYGLFAEAKKLLENLKTKEPENMDLHRRLKAIYLDTDDKELAVTECLILNELYKRQGDTENAGKILKDACEIYPEDPRLMERVGMSLIEPTSLVAEGDEIPGGVSAGSSDIEDHQDKIAEADFYARQGLIQEATKILENLHKFFPDDSSIIERLERLGQGMEADETPGGPEVTEAAAETATEEDMAVGPDIAEETATEEVEPQEEPEEFRDISFTDQDIIGAEEIPEPELDNDVMEIFQEFKKGIEKELSDEDSETHYNLGIAYKEMGLFDDAIKEFQTSRKDPKRQIQSSTMLGSAYMEKGLYSLAIDALGSAIKSLPEQDGAHWAVKYELAEAYEKNGNIREALDLYTAVYGWDAKFRDVAEKVTRVKVQLAKGGEPEKIKERKDRVSYL